MAYSKTTWTNGITPLNAQNMNKIESGIFDNSQELENVKGMLGDPEKTAAAAALVANLSEDPSLGELNARLDSVADYVVEEGTSGVWTYEKRASGKIELWTNSIPLTINFENLGPIWISSTGGILVPIVTDIEFVTGGDTSWHYANWSSVTKNWNSGNKIDIRHYGINENGNGETIMFSAYVIGRWK